MVPRALNATVFRGFTLVELVIVITLMSAVGVLVARLMTQPFDQYAAASRRAELTSLANAAVSRMVIDLQNAVPNSVRVLNSSADVTILELLLAADGGRYRDTESTQADATSLAPGIDDASFNVLGGLSSLTSIPANARVVVNPYSTSLLYSAASGTDVIGIITPTTTVVSMTSPSASEDQITLSTAFKFDPFDAGSPRKRMYITTTPVTYRCSEVSGELRRYTNYSVTSTMQTGAPSGADDALVVNRLSSCEFLYSTAISQRLGVVTLNLQVSSENEPVSIVKQVRVFNVP